MNAETKSETHIKIPLQDLRLRPGTEMTIVDSKNKTLAHEAQFITVFPGRSVLVSLLVDDIKKIVLHENETYTFKGFTGIYDFAFTAKVLKVDGGQFNARLTCPDIVSIIIIRSNIRAKVSLAANAIKDNATTPVAVQDLSAGGAGISAQNALGSVGDRIQVVLPVIFEKKSIQLSLDSEIRHIQETDGGLRIGVEFIDLSDHNKLMLHYFVNSVHETGAI